MEIVFKNTIAAALLSGTVFVGGPALAQQQSVDGASTSQTGTNVILPQNGASGEVDTSSGSNTSVEGSGVGADTAATKKLQDGSAAEGSARTQGGGSAETAADAPATEQSSEASTSEPSNETTASIDITTEQRTEIRSVIVESNAEPVDIDIQVNVGVVIPRTVKLRPLPARIIEIVPAYRSYQYFVLVDGRIIIVEPGTLKVVYVVAA